MEDISGNIFIATRKERVKTDITTEGKLSKVTYVVTCTICNQEFLGRDRISARRAHIAHIFAMHRNLIDEFLRKNLSED